LPAELHEIRSAFKQDVPRPLGQAWRDCPEDGFQAGEVLTGWNNETLFVLAELTTSKPYSKATANHQHLWKMGDTFEIFLRPAQQESYFEFHISPQNYRLQFCFPGTGVIELIRTKSKTLDDYLVREPLFKSTTWIEPASHRWSVLAEIPAPALLEKPAPLPGSEWLFSFSRYDYIRGGGKPVLSSTSAHRGPKFHCQEEWGRLRFV
jgi:hypothetical protein